MLLYWKILVLLYSHALLPLLLRSPHTYSEDFETPDDPVVGAEKFNQWKERLVLAPLTPGGDAVIGSGASCKIYRVQDRKFQIVPPQQIGYRNTTWIRPRPEYLALKVMDGSQKHIRKMWRNEVRNLRHLAPLTSSRHLVEFVDAYRYDNYYYILTAFYPGGDLFTAVENMGAKQSNELDAAKLLLDMFRALYACHRHNVAHRDVKPENFVFDVKGNETSLRLIDFGCSKFGPDDLILKDKPQSVYYVAPEVLAPDTTNEPRYCWRRCIECSELYLCPSQPPEDELPPKSGDDEFSDDDYSEDEEPTSADPNAPKPPKKRRRRRASDEVGAGVCVNGQPHKPDPNGRYRLRRPAGYDPQPDGSSGPAPTPQDLYLFKLTSGVAVFAPCAKCGSLVCADRNVPGQAFCRATRGLHELPTTQSEDASQAMGLDGVVSPVVGASSNPALSPTPLNLTGRATSNNSQSQPQPQSQQSPQGSNGVNPTLSKIAAHSSYGLLTRGLRPGVRKVLREGGWKVCACCAVVYRAPLVPLNTARNPALLQREAHPPRHEEVTTTDYDENGTTDPTRQALRDQRAADAVDVVNTHGDFTGYDPHMNRLASVTTMLPDSESTISDSVTRERGDSRISEASTTVVGLTDSEMSVSRSSTPGVASRTTSDSVTKSPYMRPRQTRSSRSSSRSSRGSSESGSSTPQQSNRSNQTSYGNYNPYELPFDLRVEFDPLLTKQLEVATCPFALSRTLPRPAHTRPQGGCFSDRGMCGFLFGDEADNTSTSKQAQSAGVTPEGEPDQLNEDHQRQKAQQLLMRMLHRPFTCPIDESEESKSPEGGTMNSPYLTDPVAILDDDVYEETMRLWGRHTPLDFDGFGEIYEDEAEEMLLQLGTYAESVDSDGRALVTPMAGPTGSLSPRRRFEAARALNVDLDGDGKPLFALTTDGNPSRRATEFFIEVSRTMNIGMWKASDMWSMGVVMYVLLTGCAPFYSQDFHKIPGIISACDWTMPEDLSPAAKDLLSRLLQRDPLLRPTAWQVLHHPWLHSFMHKSSRPLKYLAAALEDLRYHDDSAHLRRIFARAVITQQLHNESRFDEVKNVLSAFDHDGDGELSVDDVASLVAVLEDRQRRALAKQQQKRAAITGEQKTNDAVDAAAAAAAEEESTGSDSPSLNSIPDGDFPLPIESADLQAADASTANVMDSIDGVKPELSLRHVDFATQAMQNLMLTRENKLSYTELKVIIAAATLGTPSSFLGDYATVFQLLDTKRDGYLDHEELSAACSMFLSRDEVSDLLVVMDENGDGKINLREFTNALSRQSHIRRGGSPLPGAGAGRQNVTNDSAVGSVDIGDAQGGLESDVSMVIQGNVEENQGYADAQVTSEDFIQDSASDFSAVGTHVDEGADAIDALPDSAVVAAAAADADVDADAMMAGAYGSHSGNDELYQADSPQDEGMELGQNEDTMMDRRLVEGVAPDM